MLLLALSALALAASSPAAAASAPDDLFPAAKGDLVVVAGEGEADWTVIRLLEEYAALTGQALQVDQETRRVLEQRRTGLTRSASIAAAEVQGFVEGLLAQCYCLLEPAPGASPALVAVRSLETSERSRARSHAIHVPVEELEPWAAHPAVLITTSVRLPHADVRQLSNAMRTLVVDANIQQILSAGMTSSMLVAGPGPWVVDAVRLLREADEAARLDAPAPLVERFALRHADATEVAGALEALASAPVGGVQAQGQGPIQNTNALRVLTDARTNALVVVATPQAMAVVRSAIELLDVEA